MYNYDADRIDELERKLAGLSPRKEVTLPLGALMTKDEVTASLLKTWRAALAKTNK